MPARKPPPAQPVRKRAALRIDDVRGAVRLAVEGVHGVTHIAEGLHGTIVQLAPPVGAPAERPPGGISGFVYRTVRSGSALVGAGLDATLAAVQELLRTPGNDPPSAAEAPQRLALLAALNGVLGDHLERTGNPLALRMEIAQPASNGPRLLLLVHGLCLNDLQWTRGGHDHGRALQQAAGWTPVYVRYNSGRHVSANGAELAALLEDVAARWPVPLERIAILGHSMGGLVARSAIHQAHEAGMAWPQRLRHLVFLGTPHHGAALERAGNWVHAALGVSPYLAPFARLGGLRSDGITDLRHGNLLEADWQGGRFTHGDTRTIVPLPAGVACHAVAGLLADGTAAQLLGDGLVSVDSALGRHARKSHDLHIPASRTAVLPGVGHLALLESEAVYRRLRRWLGAAPSR